MVKPVELCLPINNLTMIFKSIISMKLIIIVYADFTICITSLFKFTNNIRFIAGILPVFLI